MEPKSPYECPADRPSALVNQTMMRVTEKHEVVGLWGRPDPNAIGQPGALRIAHVILDGHILRGLLHRRFEDHPLLRRQLALEMQRSPILVPSHPEVPKLRVGVGV